MVRLYNGAVLCWYTHWIPGCKSFAGKKEVSFYYNFYRPDLHGNFAGQSWLYNQPHPAYRHGPCVRCFIIDLYNHLKYSPACQCPRQAAWKDLRHHRNHYERPDAGGDAGLRCCF